MHNYNKAQLISRNKLKEIDHMKILLTQLKLKNSKQKIYVLSTFPLIMIDYNLEKAINILKMKLKDNYLEVDDKVVC